MAESLTVAFQAKIGLFPREKAYPQRFRLTVYGAGVQSLWSDVGLTSDCEFLFSHKHCRLLESAAAGLYAYVKYRLEKSGFSGEVVIELAKLDALRGLGTPVLRCRTSPEFERPLLFKSPDFTLRVAASTEKVTRVTHEGTGLRFPSLQGSVLMNVERDLVKKPVG